MSTSVKPRKIEPCMYFEDEKCKHTDASKCSFAHGPEDLQLLKCDYDYDCLNEDCYRKHTNVMFDMDIEVIYNKKVERLRSAQRLPSVKTEAPVKAIEFKATEDDFPGLLSATPAKVECKRSTAVPNAWSKPVQPTPASQPATTAFTLVVINQDGTWSHLPILTFPGQKVQLMNSAQFGEFYLKSVQSQSVQIK